jgi:cell division inhibitor SepF
MSLWKRTMDYLGLGPDDAYDDYDGYDEPEAPTRSRAPREPEHRPAPPSAGRDQRGWEPEEEPAVRTVAARPSFPSRDFDASPSRRAANGRSDDSGVQVRPAPAPTPTLRTVPGGSMEPHTVRPRRFDQAQEVADKFKDGQPVIMNLEGTERDVARRLIDFASGICYSLDGSMEKVATGVYLLKPPSQRPSRFDDYDD